MCFFSKQCDLFAVQVQIQSPFRCDYNQQGALKPRWVVQDSQSIQEEQGVLRTTRGRPETVKGIRTKERPTRIQQGILRNHSPQIPLRKSLKGCFQVNVF
jgi:hypothetical protein